MINIKKFTFGIGLALLIIFACAFCLPNAKKRWVRHTGAVIPGGSSTLHYTDKPCVILSVTGERWAPSGKLEEASAYHALIIFPTLVPEPNPWTSGGDSFIHTDVQHWRVPNGEGMSGQEMNLAVVYDSVWQTIMVESKSYQLAKGNMFVIRYDRDGRSTVTQLNATMNQRDWDAAVKAFKSMMPDDPLVERL